MYIQLKIGDRLKEGDEHKHRRSGGWRPIAAAIGKRIKSDKVKYRRWIGTLDQEELKTCLHFERTKPEPDYSNRYGGAK